MKKLKPIFLVGTRWFGVLGPCKLLIEELRKRGHDVYIFGQKDKHYAQFDTEKVNLIKLNVRRSYYSLFLDWMDIIKLCFYIKKLKPVSIHSFNPKPSLLCYFSILLTKKRNFFIGVTGLGNTFIKAKRLEPYIAYLMGLAAKKANYIFFQNVDDRSLFINKLNVDKEKTKIFRSPGVDTLRFKLKTKYEFKHKIRVLLVARLLWQKGVGDFVETFKSLKQRNLEKFYEFTLVGEIDAQHPDRLNSSDVKNITNLGINWVKWTDKIEEIYKENDILLFMSKREGGPRAILESSAIGLPTIGSNCIGVRELIQDGITGFIVETANIDGIIEKLEYYRNDKDQIIKHGQSARINIAEELSLINATKAQLEMYEVNY